MARAGVPLRLLCLGRRGSIQACRARASCRADCGQRMLYEGHCAGERRLFIGARLWCDVPATASDAQSAITWHARACHARCVLGGDEALGLAARARRAALVVIGLRPVEGRCAGERRLCFGARPRRDVPAVASNAQSAIAWHAWARHCARYVSGGGAALNPAARARRAVLVVVGVCPMEGYCAGERRFFCSVQNRGATCRGLQRTVGYRVARAGTPLRSLCLGRRRITRACRARAPCRAGLGWAMPSRRTLRRRERLFFEPRPWRYVLAMASNAKPAPCVAARRRHAGPRCLWGGGAAFRLAARAQRAALVVIG